MRPYGLPRFDNVEWPDAADICFYALKSSVGRFRKKGGDFANAHRTSSTKRRTRRIWKKKERAFQRAFVRFEFKRFVDEGL